MSSPPRHRLTGSPIRNLEKSPRRSRYLGTIAEEDPRDYHRYSITSPENSSLFLENKVLNETVRNYAEESHHFVRENSRLQKENESLKLQSYEVGVIEVNRLAREIVLKDSEIEKLKSDVQILRNHYEKDLEKFELENKSLRSQLAAL